MLILNRAEPADYHYHAYMCPGDNTNRPYGLSLPQANQNNYEFDSLRKDLKGLVTDGKKDNVPTIKLNYINEIEEIVADNNYYQALVFQLGNLNTTSNLPNIGLTRGIHAREWKAPEILGISVLMIHLKLYISHFKTGIRLVMAISDRNEE